MTGGQMAPTTLPGQKTQTSPYGRSVENEGFPMKICEMVAALDSPVYVERVALNNPANIRKAKSALRKAFTYMRDKKGFSLVEFLSSCPVNLKMSPPESDKWISEKMISYFPLSKFKDIGAERQPKKNMKPVYDSDIVRDLLYPQEDNFNDIEKISEKKDFTIKIKCAGFGGQGILSLGMIIAEAAHQQGFQVTWLPSYGPEMRGGTANCSVVISSKKISSPIIEKADVMIIFSQLAMDKFKNDMENNGILIYDENNVNTLKDEPDNYRIFNFNASEIAKNLGDSRIANTLMLGATSHFIKEISRNSFLKAIRKAFANKEHILDLNLRAFGEGQKIAMQRYSKEN